MLFHPLVIAVLFLDLLSLIVLFSAIRILLQFILGNKTDDGAKVRISPGRCVLVLQCVSFLLLLVGVSLIFPPILTGIMCGTGVLKISGETGVRMLLVRICTLLVLFVWYQLDSASRELPEKDMKMIAAKGMLFSVPFVVLGVWLSAKTLWLLNTGVSGDCCSLAYGATDVGGKFSFNPDIWLLFLTVSSIGLFLLALFVASKKESSQRLIAITSCCGIVWCLPASVCLLYYFSAYYYGVSQHPCFWCLFLPGNYFVGYPLFFAMTLVFSQSVVLFVYGRFSIFKPQLLGWSRKKMRKSAGLIIAGMLLYFLLTGCSIIFL